MSDMKPLLIELGTEELPVKALPGLAQALFDGVIDGLVKRGIAIDRGEAKPLYSPRRLAVLLPGVAVEQPQQKSEVLGPYLNIALDPNGAPTKALQGFAQKAGVDWTQLEKTTDSKGERFVHRAIKHGARIAELLPEIVREAIATMPIGKPMRWGDHDHGFARPMHWLVLLLGDDVVEGEVLGIKAGRNSRGHRFMHPKPVWIGTPGDYVDALRAAHVLVDPDERRARIVREVERAANDVGGIARIDADNLEQVNCLTEWPSAVLCGFDREFLAVPQEALVATMQTNQKFFPVLDSAGKLTEYFIGIANIQSKDVAEVRKGYERVIRPRFADAKFFFVEDMKQGLASMNEGLKTVTYQLRLGTVANKVARVAALAEAIAGEVGVDPKLARRAAELSKADLQSRLVNEFPELQGIAGRYYAAVENEPLELATAIDEAYRPRHAGDAIAPSKLGQVLAIAERLDTLAGAVSFLGLPTGSKDPFALRRSALGLARTIIESAFDLDLQKLLAIAETVLRDNLADRPLSTMGTSPYLSETGAMKGQLGVTLYDFILDRLRGYYSDQGVAAQQFESVSSVMQPIAAEAAPTETKAHRGAVAGAASAASSRSSSLLDFDHRIKAIGEFAKLPEAEALAAANKRIRNILKKVEGAIPADVDPALFAEPAERELFDAVQQAITDTDDALEHRDYVAVLGRLARLRPQVDAFFDKVMVNVDDPAVRNNRLALLQRLAERLGSVAAIEHLST